MLENIKLKQKFRKFRPTLYKWLAITIFVISSFVYGTFKPNAHVVHKIVSKVESDIVETAHSFGLHEPTFEYNSDETFISALKTCIDYINFRTAPSKRVPSAIIIGMAGIESGWGTSRFAREGNNLFGIRTWDSKVPQLKPLDLPNAEFGVKIFNTKCSSVQEMIRLLNEHHAYKDFRDERLNQDGDWNYRKLLETLEAWSTNPQYAGIVFDTIITRQLP